MAAAFSAPWICGAGVAGGYGGYERVHHRQIKVRDGAAGPLACGLSRAS